MRNKFMIIGLFFIFINLAIWPKNKNEQKINEEVVYPNKFTITLTGEVAFPKAYTFFEPIKIRDLVKLAGGFTKDADLSLVDENYLLTKNEIINIKKTTKNNDENNQVFTKINLNTAKLKDLIQVPGITENIAVNILVYKNQYGKFESIDELQNVKQIGQKTYEKIFVYFEI
ncbi:ComEA family DNA-binding protein [Haploplasma modicum]|uniref:ComEA family DNA-binding protein n=1 Tax=Haploplasma modicum TaxID=2150 RepID=UPI00214B89CB|nr:ComEA family DNA-binding protein [Haploplasma modicum]MCR1809225.1 ComEA family DNA-binding protein [Haploplasma modicum]